MEKNKDKLQQFENREKHPVGKPEWSWPLGTINPIQTDPFGMYTGTPADSLEEPVQDADDL